MKKFFTFIAFAIAIAGYSYARTSYVKQVIIANGAGTKVYVSAYNPQTGLTTTFDSINVGYVQDVVVSGNAAYVAATDSIIKYNLDSYTRTDEIAFVNPHELYVYNDKLIAGRWIAADNNIWTTVLDTSDLSIAYDIPEIDNQTYGITVLSDTAYIAVYGGYGNPNGKIAVIDLISQNFVRFIDYGTNGEGIGNLFSDGNYVYTINETWNWNNPADTVGAIGIYNNQNGNTDFHFFNHNIGRGYFVNYTALFLQVNGNIGVFDLYGETLDTNRISPEISGGTFSSVAFDNINNRIYANLTDYYSFGQGYIYDLAGSLIDTYDIGISADAMDIDYRISTSVNNTINDIELKVFPQPANDYLNICSDENITKISIYNLNGMKICTQNNNSHNYKFDISGFSKGIYILKVNTDNNIITKKININ